MGVVELARAMGGNKDMGRPMAVHLEEFGLVRVEEVPGPIAGRVSYQVRLTPRGEKFARSIEKLVDILPDE